MADDTLTVEQAKRALSSAIADYGDACRRREGIHTVDALPDRIDALIAAVRAENAPPVGSELDNLKRILKATRQSDLDEVR